MYEEATKGGRRVAQRPPKRKNRVLRYIGRTLLALLGVAAVLLAGLCMIMD